MASVSVTTAQLGSEQCLVSDLALAPATGSSACGPWPCNLLLVCCRPVLEVVSCP